MLSTTLGASFGLSEPFPDDAGWLPATSGPLELPDDEPEGELEGEDVEVVFEGCAGGASASGDSAPDGPVDVGEVEPRSTTAAPSAPPVRGPPRVAAVSPPPARADSTSATPGGAVSSSAAFAAVHHLAVVP